jgi:hypothetical protein
MFQNHIPDATLENAIVGTRGETPGLSALLFLPTFFLCEKALELVLQLHRAHFFDQYSSSQFAYICMIVSTKCVFLQLPVTLHCKRKKPLDNHRNSGKLRS